MRHVTVAAAGLALLIAAGCSRSTASWDAVERDMPLLRRALNKAREGDVDSAIRIYVQALDADPRIARAHFDLALLLHDQKKDYLRAIYHYERYLELRPDTEKRAMIENRLRLARQAYMGTLMKGGGVPGERLDELERENQRLKERVAELEGELDRAKAAGAAAPAPVQPAAGGIGQAAAADGRPATYVVKRGDTLINIAERMYGDPLRWRAIYEANRALLGGADKVKIGQELTIP